MMKDRSHYGLMNDEGVMVVTPEQAETWLITRPPAPIMWSRDVPDNEKSHRLAAAMEAGEWDVDRPVEPVIIAKETTVCKAEYCRGGHHRLAAVMHTGKPQRLRVQFYSKPDGYDRAFREKQLAEIAAERASIPHCHICYWEGTPEEIEAHIPIAHKYGG